MTAPVLLRPDGSALPTTLSPLRYMQLVAMGFDPVLYSEVVAFLDADPTLPLPPDLARRCEEHRTRFPQQEPPR